MQIVIIFVILYVAWEYLKAKKAGLPTGPTTKTAVLGGQSLPGNSYDNGSTATLGATAPCDCPPEGSSLIYANDGGESGALPTTASPAQPDPSYIAQGNILMTGDDPAPLTLVPSTTTAVSAANSKHRVRSA
jgi:hypothetical protein